MLSEYFYWLLNMSLLGSALGLIVLLLRRISVMPRRLVCWLWLMPLLRFWLPVSLPSRFSLLNLLTSVTARPVPAGSINMLPEFFYTNFIQAADGYAPFTLRSEALEKLFDAASLVWLAIFGALLITMLLLYFLAIAESRRAIHLQNKVYRSGQVSAPSVFGIFRPRILIPSSTPDSDLAWIILHEEAHIRRGDNLLRIIALITACLHWFNPLSWILLKYYFEDAELACDARVIKGLDLEGRKTYSAVLLHNIASRSLIASSFGGAKIRSRIGHILTYGRMSLAASLFFAVLIAAVAAILLTNALP